MQFMLNKRDSAVFLYDVHSPCSRTQSEHSQMSTFVKKDYKKRDFLFPHKLQFFSDGTRGRDEAVVLVRRCVYTVAHARTMQRSKHNQHAYRLHSAALECCLCICVRIRERWAICSPGKSLVNCEQLTSVVFLEILYGKSHDTYVSALRIPSSISRSFFMSLGSEASAAVMSA